MVEKIWDIRRCSRPNIRSKQKTFAKIGIAGVIDYVDDDVKNFVKHFYVRGLSIGWNLAASCHDKNYVRVWQSDVNIKQIAMIVLTIENFNGLIETYTYINLKGVQNAFATTNVIQLHVYIYLQN